MLMSLMKFEKYSSPIGYLMRYEAPYTLNTHIFQNRPTLHFKPFPSPLASSSEICEVGQKNVGTSQQP